MRAVYLALANETDMKMKKIISILAITLLMAMCSTPKATKNNTIAKTRPEVQYKDDFRAAPAKEKEALLKDLNAAGANYSVLIFTKNFKGEKVVASNANKTLHSGYLISDLKSGIADKIRIDNTLNTKILDSSDKNEIIIEAKEAQKHKFIYLMKNPGGKRPFTITYSNTLRPLE